MDNLFGIAYRGSIDEERTMQLMSVGTKQLTGHSAEYFTGKEGVPFMSVVLEEDRRGLQSRIAEALQANERFRM